MLDGAKKRHFLPNDLDELGGCKALVARRCKLVSYLVDKSERLEDVEYCEIGRGYVIKKRAALTN